MGGILGQIWELPWYQVMIIAAADDVMVFFKLWWLWLIIIVVGTICAIAFN